MQKKIMPMHFPPFCDGWPDYSHAAIFCAFSTGSIMMAKVGHDENYCVLYNLRILYSIDWDYIFGHRAVS